MFYETGGGYDREPRCHLTKGQPRIGAGRACGYVPALRSAVRCRRWLLEGRIGTVTRIQGRRPRDMGGVNHQTELRAAEAASGFYLCVFRDAVAVDGADVVPLIRVIVVACQNLGMRGLAEKVGVSHGRFKLLPMQLVAVFLDALSVRIGP